MIAVGDYFTASDNANKRLSRIAGHMRRGLASLFNNELLLVGHGGPSFLARYFCQFKLRMNRETCEPSVHDALFSVYSTM